MQSHFRVIPRILHSSVGVEDKQLQKTLSMQNVWRFNSVFHQDKNIFIYDTLVDGLQRQKAHIGGKDSDRERKEDIPWPTKQYLNQKRNSVCLVPYSTPVQDKAPD